MELVVIKGEMAMHECRIALPALQARPPSSGVAVSSNVAACRRRAAAALAAAAAAAPRQRPSVGGAKYELQATSGLRPPRAPLAGAAEVLAAVVPGAAEL